MSIDRNRFTDSYEQRLLRMYSEINSDLKDILIDALANGKTTDYYLKLKKQVSEIIRSHNAKIKGWSYESTDKIYRRAVQLVDNDVKRLGIDALDNFGRINQNAISILAENTFGKLETATAMIGRSADDELRKMGLASIRGTVGGYESVGQAKIKLREQIKSKIGGYVTYKDGKQVPAKVYAEMVARTSTAECHRMATQNRILQTFDNNDLVEIVGPLDEKNRPACENAVGKVYSLEGLTAGYPLLSEYIADGGFGVNCRHDSAVTSKVISEYKKKNINF